MFQSQNKVIRGENSQSSVILSSNISHMRHEDIKTNVLQFLHNMSMLSKMHLLFRNKFELSSKI